MCSLELGSLGITMASALAGTEKPNLAQGYISCSFKMSLVPCSREQVGAANDGFETLRVICNSKKCEESYIKLITTSEAI